MIPVFSIICPGSIHENGIDSGPLKVRNVCIEQRIEDLRA